MGCGLLNVSLLSLLQLKVDKLRLIEVCGTSESEFSCVSDIVVSFRHANFSNVCDSIAQVLIWSYTD